MSKSRTSTSSGQCKSASSRAHPHSGQRPRYRSQGSIKSFMKILIFATLCSLASVAYGAREDRLIEGGADRRDLVVNPDHDLAAANLDLAGYFHRMVEGGGDDPDPVFHHIGDGSMPDLVARSHTPVPTPLPPLENLKNWESGNPNVLVLPAACNPKLRFETNVNSGYRYEHRAVSYLPDDASPEQREKHHMWGKMPLNTFRTVEDEEREDLDFEVPVFIFWHGGIGNWRGNKVRESRIARNKKGQIKYTKGSRNKPEHLKVPKMQSGAVWYHSPMNNLKRVGDPLQRGPNNDGSMDATTLHRIQFPEEQFQAFGLYGPEQNYDVDQYTPMLVTAMEKFAGENGFFVKVEDGAGNWFVYKYSGHSVLIGDDDFGHYQANGEVSFRETIIPILRKVIGCGHYVLLVLDTCHSSMVFEILDMPEYADLLHGTRLFVIAGAHKLFEAISYGNGLVTRLMNKFIRAITGRVDLLQVGKQAVEWANTHNGSRDPVTGNEHLHFYRPSVIMRMTEIPEGTTCVVGYNPEEEDVGLESNVTDTTNPEEVRCFLKRKDYTTDGAGLDLSQREIQEAYENVEPLFRAENHKIMKKLFDSTMQIMITAIKHPEGFYCHNADALKVQVDAVMKALLDELEIVPDNYLADYVHLATGLCLQAMRKDNISFKIHPTDKFLIDQVEKARRAVAGGDARMDGDGDDAAANADKDDL